MMIASGTGELGRPPDRRCPPGGHGEGAACGAVRHPPLPRPALRARSGSDTGLAQATARSIMDHPRAALQALIVLVST